MNDIVGALVVIGIVVDVSVRGGIHFGNSIVFESVIVEGAFDFENLVIVSGVVVTIVVDLVFVGIDAAVYVGYESFRNFGAGCVIDGIFGAGIEKRR